MVTYGSLGATAIPLGLPEWIPAFQTGMAQVVMTPITFALPSGLTKVAPVATRWGMIDTPGFSLMNKASFDKLSKPQQEALLRARDARTPVGPVAQRRFATSKARCTACSRRPAARSST